MRLACIAKTLSEKNMYNIVYAGISSKQMAISEIGVSFPDDSFGKESRFGIPFTVSI